MKAVIALLFVLGLIVAVAQATSADAAQKRSYYNHRLIRVKVTTQKSLEQLQLLLGEERNVFSHDGSMGINRVMDILVPPQQYAELQHIIAANHASEEELSAVTMPMFEIMSENYQEVLDEVDFMQRTVELQEKLTGASINETYFKRYHPYQEVVEFFTSLNRQYPKITSMFTVGQTWEQRNIIGIKISVNSSSNAERPIVLFNALQHAREWISTAVVSYAAQNMLEKYTAGDADVTTLLQKVDVVIIPIVNADGYEYTWTKDRLWRKNRRNNGAGKAYGVDLNRNWPVGYGTGSSSSPSSDIYRGPSALSEPESKSYADWLQNNAGNIKAAIDFHSYSQLVLRPWDYTEETSPIEAQTRALGKDMQSAIKQTHGLDYQNIRGVELYPAGGALNDNFYGSFKVEAPYTIELRDTGRYGFVLPPEQIIPCAEENWNAIMVIAKSVAAKY